VLEVLDFDLLLLIIVVNRRQGLDGRFHDEAVWELVDGIRDDGDPSLDDRTSMGLQLRRTSDSDLYNLQLYIDVTVMRQR
jgi:hypothetical protein